MAKGRDMQKKLQSILPYAILVILVLFTTYPIFINLDNEGDFDQHCFFNEVPRKTILEFGQFPFWNPYSAGGRPALAHPQYSFTRPTYVLTLLFGCKTGLRLDLVILFLVGIFGMFAIARHYKLPNLAAITTATLFALSSYFILRIIEGHNTFQQIMLIPWVFFFYLKSFKNEKYILISAALFALSIFSGSTAYTFMPFTIFFGAYSITQALQDKKWRPVILFAIMIIVALLFSAFKTLPTIDYLHDNPRFTTTSNQFTSLLGVSQVFLNSMPEIMSKHFFGQVWGWHEYTAYTGILPLLLFIVGIFLFWKKTLPLLVAGGVGFVLSLGTFAKYAPWSLLHMLPVFNSLRVPSRFIILFIFTLAIVVGFTIKLLLEKTKRRKVLRFMLFIAILIVIVDISAVGNRMLQQDLPSVEIEIEPSDEFRQFFDPDPEAIGGRSKMVHNLWENKGTLNSLDPVPHQHFAKGYNEDGYQGEVYLLGNGTAEYVYWSPNRLDVEVKAEENTLLVINQNFADGWRVVDGRAVESYNGLLAANVTSEDSIVSFKYRAPYAILGGIISLASIFGVILLWKHRKTYIK